MELAERNPLSRRFCEVRWGCGCRLFQRLLSTFVGRRKIDRAMRRLVWSRRLYHGQFFHCCRCSSDFLNRGWEWIFLNIVQNFYYQMFVFGNNVMKYNKMVDMNARYDAVGFFTVFFIGVVTAVDPYFQKWLKFNIRCNCTRVMRQPAVNYSPKGTRCTRRVLCTNF